MITHNDIRSSYRSKQKVSLVFLLFELLGEACLGEERGEEKEDKVEDQGHDYARPVF